MKKFMKVCAIMALILLVLGFGMSIVAGAAEGTTRISEIVDTITDGKLNINLESITDWGIQIDEENLFGTGIHYDITENMVFDDDYEVFSGDVAKTSVGNQFSNLDVEAGGCTLFFRPSEDTEFYVEAKGCSKFQYYIEEETLFIKVMHTVDDLTDYDNCEIVLYVPEGFEFACVDLELGAGLMEIGTICAKSISAEVGAGQICVNSLETEECIVEVGMGEIVIDGMQIKNMYAEVGMGHLSLTGTVLDNANIECSMGAIDFIVSGQKEDFNYTIEAAMGNVSVDGVDYSGLARDKTIENGADKQMDIECAMGNIDIQFTE